MTAPLRGGNAAMSAVALNTPMRRPGGGTQRGSRAEALESRQLRSQLQSRINPPRTTYQRPPTALATEAPQPLLSSCDCRSQARSG
ncbi:hypothetical protein FHY18_004325 [Xanthomonas arboricola]|nr:hypothetical protein [Xanthomonas sp. 3793]